jgi:protease II
LAYTTDTVGDEIYRLYIKDLESGRTVDTGITEISECIWRADSDQLFLTKQNSRLQTDQLWLYSRVSREEILIYKELDPTFTLGLHYSTGRDMIFLTASSKNSTEVRFINSRGTGTQWTLLSYRQPGHEYYPDFFDGLFYILSNKQTLDGIIFVCASQQPQSNRLAGDCVPGASASSQSRTFWFAILACSQDQASGLFERLEVHSRRRPEMLYVLPVPEISDYSFWVNEDPREAAFYYTRESELTPRASSGIPFQAVAISVLYVYEPPREYYPEQYRTDLRMVRAAMAR